MTQMEPGCEKVEILSDIVEGVGLKTRWTQQQEGAINVWEEEISEWDPPRKYSFISYTGYRQQIGSTEKVQRYEGPIEMTGSQIITAIDPNTTKLTFTGEFYNPKVTEAITKVMKHLVNRVKLLSEAE